MSLLLIKLILTPVFIGLVTLAGRRWGVGASGVLTGLPLTSGPVSIFLSIQYGTDFAARAAVGNMVGLISVSLFCVAYVFTSRYARWSICVMAGSMTFLAATVLWNAVDWTLLGATVVTLLSIFIATRLIVRVKAIPIFVSPPVWDLPLRMVIATAFVLVITTFAELLGPQLSGLLAPFPVFTIVLAAFTHQQAGIPNATKLLRNIVLGTLASAAFFVATSSAMSALGAVPTYLIAWTAALTVSFVVYVLSQRGLNDYEHNLPTSYKP